MAAKTAFVTGGTGFLGINLIDRLIAAGWDVTALHRPSSDLRHLCTRSVKLAPGDITDRASLQEAMPEGLDGVFHVAGNLSLDARGDEEQARVNVEGTRNMAEVAMTKNAGRFIHTSSVAAFGMHPNTITEETPSISAESPINYLRTKKSAEDEIDRAIGNGLDAVILNPANILGPYDNSGWASLIMLVAKRKLPGIGPGGGNFCDVTEVANAHIAAYEKGRTGERYLLGGPKASFLEFTQLCEKLVGGRAPKRAFSPRMLNIISHIMYWPARLTGRKADLTPEAAALTSGSVVVDSSKAERELDYRQVPLEEMVRASAAWLTEQGLLARI